MGTNEVLALIGPSGVWKTTFLRCINRMNDTIQGCRVSGTIKIDDEEINHADADVVSLRSRVGMVFQKPNPFAKSIYDNIAYGPRIHALALTKSLVKSWKTPSSEQDFGRRSRTGYGRRVPDCQGGRQQRLCARAMAVLRCRLAVDEPCSATGPIATLGDQVIR